MKRGRPSAGNSDGLSCFTSGSTTHPRKGEKDRFLVIGLMLGIVFSMVFV